MPETCTHSVCSECPARCCRTAGPGFRWLYLNGEERHQELFAQHSEHVTGRLEFTKGRCPFLGSDHRCTIYERRPEACRLFECWNVKEFPTGWKDKPHHRRLLKTHEKLP